MQSGHPLGVFQSSTEAPRVIITNGLMVGLYDNPRDWEIAAQMGVSSYGQMTAGGWMYIGPPGASFTEPTTPLSTRGRKFCDAEAGGDLSGLLFVSSGLGGMSGAQPKAAKIAGITSITAEVDASRVPNSVRTGMGGPGSQTISMRFSRWQPRPPKKNRPHPSPMRATLWTFWHTW